jgi:hypothetical protein
VQRPVTGCCEHGKEPSHGLYLNNPSTEKAQAYIHARSEIRTQYPSIHSERGLDRTAPMIGEELGLVD